MAQIQIPAGSFAIIQIAGRGTVTQGTALAPGATAKIGDYAHAYAADMGVIDSGVNAGLGRKLAIVPRLSTLPTGGNVQTNIALNGVDAQSGQPLAQTVYTVELDGSAPLPPAATEFGLYSIAFGPLASAPADPGSDTVTF